MSDSHVSTGCPPLDDLLGGGLERGQVTQLYGPPGAGKTNVALSAAVQAADAGGTAVYVDTEGVSVERFRQILEANAEDPDEAAGNVVIESAHDFAEQAEAVRDASDFAERADLVVVDSITGFYRLERGSDDQGGDSLREVTRQVTHLLSLARKHDLAVAVTNQVYSDPDAGTDSVRPLGGHTLMHWTGVVVRLERYKGNRRRAVLEKHGAKPEGERANFAITDRGLEAPSA
ncbi:DNA repair and recombination protein RadB [Halocalculus aciditolerans]|uniref:DNA repair and recombination protein RadB n=1 Tax=Halocalculus aciditolerans TaxID=1383812 RepID=A0A830FFL0_9EURY|nr:DNA repair and recombination protein RadB [Halocalculus aciditolerans]GGL50498.1 DNA repair protein RadB [Halocalculus aciditolerans]